MTEKSYGNRSDINKLFNCLMGKANALKSLTKMNLSVQFYLFVSLQTILRRNYDYKISDYKKNDVYWLTQNIFLVRLTK